MGRGRPSPKRRSSFGGFSKLIAGTRCSYLSTNTGLTNEEAAFDLRKWPRYSQTMKVPGVERQQSRLFAEPAFRSVLAQLLRKRQAITIAPGVAGALSSAAAHHA